MNRTVRFGAMCAIAGSAAACRLLAGVDDLPDSPFIAPGDDGGIDASLPNESGADGRVDSSDARLDGDAFPHDAHDGGPSDALVDGVVDAGDTETGVDPCDEGTGVLTTDAGVLEDACSDLEWRSLRSPLAVLRLHDTVTDADVHLVTDVHGRCRRWIKSDSVWPSPDGRALAWKSDATSLALASVSALSAPHVFHDSYIRAFSPDGAWLAFAEQHDGDVMATLRIASSPDGHDLSIGSNFFVDLFSWAPDSRQFVYSEGSSINFDCVDHCGAHQVWLDHLPDWWAVWSPDAKRVAVSSSRDGSSTTSDVFVIDVATATSKRLTTHGPNEKAETLRWSPSSKQILYADVNAPPNGSATFDVVNLCADGTCRQPLASPIPTISQYDFAWSDDERRVAFTGYDKAFTKHLYTVCPDGSCTTDLGESKGFWPAHAAVSLYHRMWDPLSSATFTVASCWDGACVQRIGPPQSFDDEIYGGWHSSHDGASLAYLGDDDWALYASSNIAPAIRVSRPSELLGLAYGVPLVGFQWTRDDKRLAYVVTAPPPDGGAQRVPVSVEATFLDGSCRSVVTPSLPSTMILKDIVSTLAPPSP